MTKALITLHGFPKSELTECITTATFIKSTNGYKGLEMAGVFYRFFDELSANNGGLIANMICANRSEIRLHSFKPYPVKSCQADYHYHLDLETMQLIVNKKDKGGSIQRVSFDGRVDAFINNYLGCVRCALLSDNPQKILTVNVLLHGISESLEHLKDHESLTQDLFTDYCDSAENLCVAISTLNLTPKEKSVLEPTMKLVTAYKDLNSINLLSNK